MGPIRSDVDAPRDEQIPEKQYFSMRKARRRRIPFRFLASEAGAYGQSARCAHGPGLRDRVRFRGSITRIFGSAKARFVLSRKICRFQARKILWMSCL